MKNFLLFVIVLSVVIGIAVVLSATVGKSYCDTLHKMSGRDINYSLIGGCYVEVDGKFIPEANWLVEE